MEMVSDSTGYLKYGTFKYGLVLFHCKRLVHNVVKKLRKHENSFQATFK